MSSIGRVENFYDASPEKEWERLARHRTEFAVSMCALSEWLPPAPASILDIGGGPGRYAIALAQLGYDVTLLDLSQANLAFAKQQADAAGVTLQGYIHGNALDLSAIPNKSFDAVLLMGPLYHLLEESERRRAVTEAMRVLKPAGVLFAACITRYAAFLDAARKEPHWLIEKPDHVEALLHAGGLRIPPGSGFTDFYAFHPVEFATFIKAAGLHALALIGVEGVVANAEESINALNGPVWDAWVEMNYRLGHDPALHGASFHLLHVGRKQGHFASAIVRQGDAILLQQAQGPSDAAPCWYIPGGTVEPYETFEQAAIREVREETGIDILRVGPVAYTTHMRHVPSGRAGVAHIFEVEDWRGEIEVNDPDKVTLQARFVPMEEAIALIEHSLPYPNMRDPLLAHLRGEDVREWHYAGDDDTMRKINP